MGSHRARPEPDDLAAGAEQVQVGGAVLTEAQPEHVGLEQRRGHRGALEHTDDLGERIDTPTRRADPLPTRQEAGQRGRVDGRDLLAQRGQRPPTELAQDLGVDPLALPATRAELALHDTPVRRQVGQREADHLVRHAQTTGELCDGEGPVGAGEALDQVPQGRVDRVGVGRGQTDRDGHTERVAQAGGILGRGQALVAGDADRDDTTGSRSCGEPVVQRRQRGLGDADTQLVGAQRAEHAQQVVHLVGVTRRRARG